MADRMESVWSGWKLLEIPEGAGGAEARHRQHLITRRRHQLAVLALLWQTHPELIRGEPNVQLSPDITQQWEASLQAGGSGSVVEIRHKVNFLSLGLSRGQRELGWDVVVPAPLRLVRPSASSFTPTSFAGLSLYRDWCRHTDKALQQSAFRTLLQQGNGGKGHRRLEPEMISWGLFLYLVITRDGLLGSKHLNSLPLATATLAMHATKAWLVLHEAVPDDMPGKVPPRSRWLLGVPTLTVLMRHVARFGAPAESASGYQAAKAYTQKAWRHFCRAVGAEEMLLSACQSYAATAFRLHVPEYLVNSSLGKHMGTALTETRWQQLLGGGYVTHAVPGGGAIPDEESTRDTGLAPVAQITAEQHGRDQPLYQARALLKSLHNAFYKRRDQKRLSFGAISGELQNAIADAQRMASIAECLCRWLLFLHQKQKRKQSTLYKYLGVTMPLLQAMGNTPVDQERLAMLVEAYQYVVEQARTEKNRHYRWAVLRSFHAFLVADLGLANVTMEFSGAGASVAHHADANCLSEEEYCLVARHLISQSDSLGEIRHWAFVLGFRAGLRIGEALSIQLDDILLHPRLKETEVILLIRNSVYVGIKSQDSRRQLPLHLLLTNSELEAFKAFVANRHAVARHGRIMLLGEGGDAVAPLRDDRVQAEIHDAMRRLTGDPSLRFHHLRHSLANYLLLSFHSVAVPWAVPAHHAALWKEVAEGPSRSGLYFIAQVMGHASPDVTLRSYLHFTCLLLDHYCHRQPTSVECAERPHAVAQLEPLTQVMGIKPATLRKWKERLGDNPLRWLGKAYPQCKIKDVALHEVVPLPPLPTTLQPERHGLSQLSLEQVEAALDLLSQRELVEVERIFQLRQGEAGRLSACALRVLTARTRRGDSAFRHYRTTAGKLLAPIRGRAPRLPLPHSLAERQIAYAMYRVIWSQWFEQQPKQLRAHLRFFYRFHRATDGHVWVRDLDAGLAFVGWVLSLNPGIGAVIEVTPSARSSHSSKQQLSEWKARLPSHQHKVEWQVKPAGKRYAQALGTGNVTFHVVNQNKRIRSGYPVRYALVVTCIVMAALATGSANASAQAGPVSE
ncbi:tyrosine-type recombinase/integrase [Billgrantia diversa]|uniref:tyrosine-type recombinase/integrase n=1 Tax=Halomonas sp. MCCC 1A13316 TaxID=2733487 RepID=UPI0018A69357|nr:tyrosine-type recombinase/integrase [Halomonas sp. MCCC 1A13316]QOR37422.1 tyrosine-type recombinase/integrase [Halomonas sp. MCCC 1A13316]